MQILQCSNDSQVLQGAPGWCLLLPGGAGVPWTDTGVLQRVNSSVKLLAFSGEMLERYLGA